MRSCTDGAEEAHGVSIPKSKGVLRLWLKAVFVEVRHLPVLTGVRSCPAAGEESANEVVRGSEPANRSKACLQLEQLTIRV